MARNNANRTVYATLSQFFELYPSEPEQQIIIDAYNGMIFNGEAQEHHRYVKKTADGWRLYFGLTRAMKDR